MKGNVSCHTPNNKYRAGFVGTKFNGSCDDCRLKNHKGHREWCQKAKSVIINCTQGEKK
jgi:hypothetical protein